MRVAMNDAELLDTYATAQMEAQSAFGSGQLYLEHYLQHCRHIEVQVLGDHHGHIVGLGERNCSVQRRNQKLIEEAPSPGLDERLRRALVDAAVRGAQAIGYSSAGTMEFLVDDSEPGRFYFLEMNTRIQVEHPVTEMITGVDLVGQQLRIARGEALPFKQSDITFTGHAIECRINAESPQHGFRPCPGRITEWKAPQGDGIRLDTHCYTGYFVPPYYDSLLAKLIVHAANRGAAADRTGAALDNFRVSGIDTLIPFLKTVIADAEYRNGAVNTQWLEKKLEAYSAAQAG